MKTFIRQAKKATFPVMLLDTSFTIFFRNEAFFSISDQNWLQGSRYFERLFNDDEERISLEYKQFILENISLPTLIVINGREQQAFKYLHYTEALYGAGDQPAGYVVRLIPLAQLGESQAESNLLAILGKIYEGVYVIQNNHFVYQNSSLFKLMDYDLQTEITPDYLLDKIVVVEEDKPPFTLRSRLNREHRINEFKIKTGQDSVMDLEITDLDIEWNGKPATLGILRDITRFKRLQEEIIRRDKISAIGNLASGIAHDFNNLLSIILGNISLARMFADERCSEFIKYLSFAEEGVNKARGLTEQLLSYGKDETPVIADYSLRTIITDALRLTLSGTVIKTDVQIQKDLWLARIDTNQIAQVFTNLFLNARQAMPNNGLLYISAENVSISDGNEMLLAPGPHIKVIVSDTGKHIPDYLVDRIFEPFVSTVLNGVGMGLSIVQKIIQKHKGHISASLEEGIGTRFTIYLPARNQADSLTVKEQDHLKQVLVLDDVMEVRLVIEKILERIGIKTVGRGSAQEAIQIYQDHCFRGEPFDLVIIDLTLPGDMDGVEVLGRLKEINENIYAIAISGFTDNPVIHHPEKYGFKNSLKKPFDYEMVLKVVREGIR
ncbi:MAG TPA: response regulator [Candidatus Marinimicrobia bacterium]|nr:response regulator [Candidatus Neomarinimicrobiota bacterium]